MSARAFDTLNRRIVACELCPRLRSWCSEVAQTKRAAYRDETYWGRPVPNFGSPTARVLIIGLAPGAHGANRTGRMFTGDSSGDWLFRALHRVGLATQPTSQSIDDGQTLIDCAITNACHCAPPGNKPDRGEVDACQPWLEELLQLLPVEVIVALGGLAWNVCRKLHADSDQRVPSFGHGREFALSPSRTLIGSYHPSRQNTNTKRLTEPMLDDVFRRVRGILIASSANRRT